MDVWVEFKNASKWQCEQLFRNFFPSSEDVFASSSSVDGVSAAELEDVEIPGITCEVLESEASSSSGGSSSSAGKGKGKGKDSPAPSTPVGDSAPLFAPPSLLTKKRKNTPLDPQTLSKLAKEFAGAIPEKEFSIAALQGCEYPFSHARFTNTSIPQTF